MRSAGLEFDEAWPEALESALKRAPRREREAYWGGWRSALRATRHAWRAAYERQGKAMQIGSMDEPEDSSHRPDVQLLA